MNYQYLGERYGRPKKKKKEQHAVDKSYLSASTWNDYKDWLKEQRLKEKLQEKAQNRSKKKGVDNYPPTKKKLNRKAGNDLKSKRMSYDEQLKDKRWFKKRKEVLKRKGYKCSECGSKFNLEIHHLEYEKGKMAWEYPMSNFVVLCKKCHKKIHGLT